MSTNREILMKFITGQTEKARQDVSLQGYKDDSPYRNNPSNTIYGSPEGTSITMEGVSTPLVGTDEFGNTQKMFPGQKYEYPGSRVVETPMAKYGGLLNKTIKCYNCGWSWKAADGGNDVSTCHKCGNQNKIMQAGGENMYTVSGDQPLIIPSQGSYPTSYQYLPDNMQPIKVPRKDINGIAIPTNILRENQKEYNRQRMVQPEYEYLNRMFDWMEENNATEKDWLKKLKKDEKENSKYHQQEGTCDPNFDPTNCGISKQHAKEDKKAWSKKMQGGTWFGNADEMSVSNKYQNAGTVKYKSELGINKLSTPEDWEKHIKGVEYEIGNPNKWTIDGYKKLQNVLNDYKFWRENTPEGKAVYDSHNEPNEYVVPLPDHLKNYQNAGTVNPTNIPEKNINTNNAAQRVVQIAEERIKNNNYVDVPKDIKDIAKARGESAFSCIGGVCTVLKEAGVMDKVDWSNTHFSEHAKEYGFTANQGWGVKGIENLEPGDVLQYNNKSNKEGNYYPGHSQIYLGKDASGQLRFFDNFWQTEKTYFEYEVKDLLDRSRKKTEPSATIYKVNPYDDSNPYGLTPEEKKNYDDKQDFIKKESASKASYKWNISPTAKNYNDTTKRVMDKFIAFANDNDKINDLVKKTGKSKEEIHDSLLNVFGELGAENNWTTSKGKGLGSRLENIAESVLTSLGGGKKLSVGPGQIKYNSIPQDLREKFNIQSPNDLYDLDKVLPLMAAMDLKDKQVLENWGKNNTLSKKLFGFTNPVETEWIEGRGNVPVGGGFTAEDLPSIKNDDSQLNNGIGRYSPYLRNQYSSIASGNTWEGGNDWIPFNEGTLPNFTEGQFTKSGQDEMRVKYERDPGSYPFKVEQNWRNNLNRFIETNADGQVELNEVEIIKPKKNKRS